MPNLTYILPCKAPNPMFVEKECKHQNYNPTFCESKDRLFLFQNLLFWLVKKLLGANYFNLTFVLSHFKTYKNGKL
jgi:hypothetical protein